MDDQAAVTRIRQGDPNGLETLVARYQVKAVQAAYLILHDRSLAEEVAQAGFVRVVEKIDQFQDGRPFTAWFFKIVINDAIKLARQQ
jgi:RNA polymerase sigma-70 factor (ECF subfamily)